MVLASTFYMLSTIEGPIQAIKSVNAIAHFTDWIPGHVHDGVFRMGCIYDYGCIIPYGSKNV